MQVSERFLLRDHVDVIFRRIRHQFAHILARHRAAWWCDQRVAGVGQRVLEVRRVDVQLDGREATDLRLLVRQRGNRSARDVVVEAAILHGGPVADRCGLQHGLRASTGDQLLQRLRTVEQATRRGTDDVRRARVGEQQVAFSRHRRVEHHLVVAHDLRGARGAQSNQLHAVAARGRDGVHSDPSLTKRLSEVARGERVVCRSCVGDSEAVADGDARAAHHFTRQRDQRNGGRLCDDRSGRGGAEQEEGWKSHAGMCHVAAAKSSRGGTGATRRQVPHLCPASVCSADASRHS